MNAQNDPTEFFYKITSNITRSETSKTSLMFLYGFLIPPISTAILIEKVWSFLDSKCEQNRLVENEIIH